MELPVWECSKPASARRSRFCGDARQGDIAQIFLALTSPPCGSSENRPRFPADESIGFPTSSRVGSETPWRCCFARDTHQPLNFCDRAAFRSVRRGAEGAGRSSNPRGPRQVARHACMFSWRHRAHLQVKMLIELVRNFVLPTGHETLRSPSTVCRYVKTLDIFLCFTLSEYGAATHEWQGAQSKMSQGGQRKHLTSQVIRRHNKTRD